MLTAGYDVFHTGIHTGSEASAQTHGFALEPTVETAADDVYADMCVVSQPPARPPVPGEMAAEMLIACHIP